MQIALVIPVKQLENAKQRLSGILSPEQRGDFFRAMVQDVMEAATTCDSVDEVFLITADNSAVALAERYAAKILQEPEEPGLIAAVTCAGEQLAADGYDAMVFLPGDVPLVSVEELEVVLDGIGRSGENEFLIVPASDLGGSNCVVCAPPDCMTFGFGEDSFRRHLKLAREQGIEPAVAKLPGIGLDVDTPADLDLLVTEIRRQGIVSHTARFLNDSGIMDFVLQEQANAGGEMGV